MYSLLCSKVQGQGSPLQMIKRGAHHLPRASHFLLEDLFYASQNRKFLLAKEPTGTTASHSGEFLLVRRYDRAHSDLLWPLLLVEKTDLGYFP